MLRFLRNAIIGSSLVLLGTAANAQVYQERGEYNQPFANNDNVVDQVRADLNEAMNMGYLSGSQRSVLAQANEDLTVFERGWERGTFIRHELDEAIARVQSVANSSRITEEQRAMLQDDVNRLRNFRATQVTSNSNGYYGNGYYGNSYYGYYRGNGYYRSSGYYDRYGNWRPYR